MDDSYWLARALFYFSLSLSLWAVIASAQQFSVIHAFPPGTDHQDTARVILRRSVNRTVSLTRRSFAELNMLYVWQVPLMQISYAWGALLVALTLHVCSPLIQHDQEDGRKVRHTFWS